MSKKAKAKGKKAEAKGNKAEAVASEAPAKAEAKPTEAGTGRGQTVVLVMLPFVLLGLFVLVLSMIDLRGIAGEGIPPVEELVFERVVLDIPSTDHGHRIRAYIRNGGPDPVTIAQVLVDEAYWEYTMTPEDRTLGRLASAVIEIPYHWVEGDAHEIRIISSSGATFDHTIDVAHESPSVSAKYLGFFTLMGFLVGIVPIAIGLLWFPAIRRMSKQAWDFILFLTVGLLVFLGIDTVHEGLEMAGAPEIAASFHPTVLFFVVAIGAYLLLQIASYRTRAGAAGRSESYRRLVLAYMIALGIGFHNLGEGLAIGAAYNAGELALGATLVIGFALHNTTEGLAIIAPLAQENQPWKRMVFHLAMVGLLAGLPTIAGAWIGGFTRSAFWGIVFMAIGAGAIFQVVYDITAYMVRRAKEPAALFNWTNLGGLVAGFAIMFGTALLV